MASGVKTIERGGDQPLQIVRAPYQLRVLERARAAAAEQLVGDVERGQHRDLQRLARRHLVSGARHLAVDIAGELDDVLLVELAADRVAQPLDLDRDDLAGFVHAVLLGAVAARQSSSASICASMSLTRL